MSISDNLYKIIKEKDISIHELANKSRVHHSGIYRILKNENKNPGIYTIKKIADSLDINIEKLLD